MFAENKPSVDYNELMLNEILGEVISINAIDEALQEIHLSDKQTETIRARKIGDTGNLASVLNLKAEAQVMLTINIDLEDRLVNGLVGKVMYLRYVSDEVKVIYVRFNDQNAGQQAIQSDIFARKRNWVPIQKYETTFPIKKNKLQPSIKRTQFSLVLSWSCTIHKVQGLSLSDGVISYELQRQKSFNQGQMYVAMSRISKLENMHLIGNYNQNAIKVNKSAKKEYERLYSECLLSPLSFPKASNDTLTIALLSDVDLMQNGILCLTETQLYLNEDISDITTKFQNNFSMYYNSSTDKHRSSAFGYSSNIFLCESSNFRSMSLVNVKKSTFLDKPVKVALLYRPPNSPSLFLQNMKSWID